MFIYFIVCLLIVVFVVIFSAYGLTIISLESVVTNAVETFLAERKKLLQEQYSSSQEDVAILSSESDVTGTTPRISVNPSSSTELLVSSTQTATSEKGKAGKKEEGKADKTHKEEVIKKEKRGEEKEEDQKDNVGEEREGEKEEQEEESPPSEGASAIVGEQVSHEQMMLVSPEIVPIHENPTLSTFSQTLYDSKTSFLSSYHHWLGWVARPTVPWLVEKFLMMKS